MRCKHARWNVKGAELQPRNQLFDRVNENVEDDIDLIVERAVQLGGIANFTAM